MNYRTDMAIESAIKDSIGVVIKEQSLMRGVKRTDVKVESDIGAINVGKPKGRYITIECKDLYDKDIELQQYTAQQIARAIRDCIEKTMVNTVLVVGLGNKHMTADALGPMVADQIIVTRHIQDEVNTLFDAKMLSMCAIAPGVLGVTGIESYDVIKGVVDHVRPDIVIVVDALASRRTERLSSAFQVTNTGIVPGAGVANHRMRLSKETLGVPVIAVGVPLVVYASTLSLELINQAFKNNPNLLPDEHSLNTLMSELITTKLGDLVVTPKDIDAIVRDCAYVMALAINLAVHNKLTVADVVSYLH